MKFSVASLLVVVSSAKAYWKPSPTTTWQLQINGGHPDSSSHALVYEVDLFDTGDSGYIQRLKRVKIVMGGRLDKAVHYHCDGVDPDNLDGYSNNNGLGLTASDQLTYNKWIAHGKNPRAEAHKRGLSIGLKNDVGQLKELQPYFYWALNESCMEYNECFRYQPFFDAGKAVFHLEYVDSTSHGHSRQQQTGVSLPQPPTSNANPHQETRFERLESYMLDSLLATCT